MFESLVRPEVSVWLWPVVAAGAAVAVLKLVSNAFFGQRRHQPRLDLEHQSKVLPGEERIHTAIYGIPRGKEYLETTDDKVHTVYDAFQRGRRVTEDGNCIGWRPAPDKPFSWLTYDEVKLGQTCETQMEILWKFAKNIKILGKAMLIFENF